MSRLSLSDAEFATVTGLLREAAGLAFDISRRDSLAFSIAARLRATGCQDVASYLTMLSAPDGASERQALIDEVTVPETHFFRNPPQIRALRTHVLPELLRQAAPRKRIRVWSAGCSTGEEPYTIAMLLRELLPAGSGWDVKVIATDISTRALEAARRATYGERAFVMTDPLDISRWFVLDTNSQAFVVRDDVRQLVEFRHHNLVTDPPPVEPGELDLVLCRNVTIYFDRDTTRTLIKRLHTQLRDGGYLFLGHAETLWQISDDFSLVPLGDAFLYRRIDGPGPDGERRAVLPDRRTESEPVPLLQDRRRGGLDRRGTDIAEGATDAAEGATDAAEGGTDVPRHGTGEARDGNASFDRVPLSNAMPRQAAARGRDPLLAVRAAIAEGRYAEAADLAADVTAATPLLADAHYLQGLALSNLRDDDAALVALRKAVYLQQDHGLAHFLLAGALERVGEPQAAARAYHAAAVTLGSRRTDAVAPELGGRSISELASLCQQLAQRPDVEPNPRGGTTP